MAGGSVDTQAVRRSSRKASSRKNRSNNDGEVSRLQATNTQKYPRTGKRGAPQVFPRKLYEILMNEPSEIVSWTDAGDSFFIKDMETFTSTTLLSYFRHQKYASFQRQLNLYGFRKICKGSEMGAYTHEHFKRQHPELLQYVRRCSHASLRLLMRLGPDIPQKTSAIEVNCIHRNIEVHEEGNRKSEGSNPTPSCPHSSTVASLLGCFKKTPHAADAKDDNQGGDLLDSDDIETNNQSSDGHLLVRSTTAELLKELETGIRSPSETATIFSHKMSKVRSDSFDDDDTNVFQTIYSSNTPKDKDSTASAVVLNQPGAHTVLHLPRAEATFISKEVTDKLVLDSTAKFTVSNRVMIRDEINLRNVMEGIPGQHYEEMLTASNHSAIPSRKFESRRVQSCSARNRELVHNTPMISMEIPKIKERRSFCESQEAGGMQIDSQDRDISFGNEALSCAPEPIFGAHGRFTSADWDLGDRAIDMDEFHVASAFSFDCSLK